MKKLISLLVIVISLLLIGIGLINTEPKQDYIRIHIRANSNITCDQNIKYLIKDKIVSYLIPSIAQCKTREDFINVIENNLEQINNISNLTLKENGFNYVSNVKFCKESFPTRSYDGFVLESGVYDSIIVELGEAKGDNWWCVVYPPLCFVSNNSQDIMYKSRILEILKSILN